MKKISLFIFILIPIFGYSQLIDSANKWNDLQVLIPTCKSASCEGNVYITHCYSLAVDTIINNYSYTIILDTFYQQEGQIQASYSDTTGYIRQLDKKVYFYSKHLNEEILLYDFGLTIGETYVNKALTFTVSSIDSLEYEGNKHLTLSLKTQYDTIQWIEDIGAKQGFLYINYSFFESSLLCFEKNDILGFKNELGLDCIVTIIASVDEINYSKIEVYPNPTEGKITIKCAEKNADIIIMNMYGKLINKFKSNQFDYIINLSHLENGIYLLKVNNETFKIIKM